MNMLCKNFLWQKEKWASDIIALAFVFSQVSLISLDLVQEKPAPTL